MKLPSPLAHFRQLGRRSKPVFLAQAWAEAVVVGYAVANFVQYFWPAAPRQDLAGLTPLRLCGLVLVAGPLFETLAFQCLPYELAAHAGVRRGLRLAVAIVPFALLHASAGLPTALAAGFVGGSYFAITYERWRRESVLVAVIMTFLLHASFNLVGAVAMLVMR